MPEKYNFTTKIYEACSNDSNRPILNCVHFSLGFAYATNGNLLVKQPMSLHSVIDAEKLDGKCLHRDNYKNIMQFEFATANNEGVECKNVDGRTAFFEYFDTKNERIPDFEKILVEFKAKDVGFIGFSPENMKLIMASMYLPMGQVRVRFAGMDRGMLIDAPGIEDQVGFLIPVLIEPSLF